MKIRRAYMALWAATLGLVGVTARGEEVVSIWSKSAGAFLSARGGRSTLANSPSVGDSERYMLLRDEEAGQEDNGQVTVVEVSGRRCGEFSLEDQGNSYFAFKRADGSYLTCDKSGKLGRHTGEIGDSERFAVVPMRKGAKVCIRAFKGWEGKLHVDHPGDFPTLKANVNTLQLSALLDPPHKEFYTEEGLSAYRTAFSTDLWESEYILRKTPGEIEKSPGKSSLGGLLQRVVLMERLGYEVDYLIVYREPMAENHAPGPWSDQRVLAPSDVEAINAMFKAAHKAGKVRKPSYRIAPLVYLFETEGFNDHWRKTGLSKGLDSACRNFIKKNFFALAMEVNSHDYARRKVLPGIAEAAAWCKKNGLEFIITSGGTTNRDGGYKRMYEALFAEMARRDVDPGSPWIHYILHHVFQPYENRLPEWEKDTTAENAKWLIEKVQKVETRGRDQ